MTITQDSIKALFIYDEQTGVFTRRVTSNARAPAGTTAGTKINGYLKVVIGRRPYLLHRLAWLYVTGEMPPPGVQIDHINQIKSDNRFANLRLATPELNAQNIRQPQGWRGRTSEHRGVHWDSRRGMWFAQIAVSGKKKFLGRFASEAQAKQAYEAARDALHPFRPANDNDQIEAAAA